MTSYRKSAATFLIFIVLFQLAVIVIGDLVRPDWSHWEYYSANEDSKHDNKTNALGLALVVKDWGDCD